MINFYKLTIDIFTPKNTQICYQYIKFNCFLIVYSYISIH